MARLTVKEIHKRLMLLKMVRQVVELEGWKSEKVERERGKE